MVSNIPPSFPPTPPPERPSKASEPVPNSQELIQELNEYKKELIAYIEEGEKNGYTPKLVQKIQDLLENLKEFLKANKNELTELMHKQGYPIGGKGWTIDGQLNTLMISIKNYLSNDPVKYSLYQIVETLNQVETFLTTPNPHGG